ncbi:MAG: hypothetical protein ACYDDF_05550 [Thermoplasmatota archaeon]
MALLIANVTICGPNRLPQNVAPLEQAGPLFERVANTSGTNSFLLNWSPADHAHFFPPLSLAASGPVDGIPAEGAGPVGNLSIRDAFDYAATADLGFRTYLQSHPNFVLVDGNEQASGASISTSNFSPLGTATAGQAGVVSINVGEPGDTLGYHIEVTRDTANGAVGVDQVAKSEPITAAHPASPSLRGSQQMTLFDGLRRASSITKAAFRGMEVNSSIDSLWGQSQQIGGRYLYVYDFDGVKVGPIQWAQRVWMDASDGAVLRIIGSINCLSSFVPSSILQELEN